MKKRFSSTLDKISDFFSQRKGLLPIVGIVLILCNFLLHLLDQNWFSQTEFLLHVGIVLAIFGFMVNRAL